MTRLKWHCLFIHDSDKCINKCLVESSDIIYREVLVHLPPTESIISIDPHQSIRPPPMIDLSMIGDRQCLPHISVCIPLMTLMSGRHFVMIDISR